MATEHFYRDLPTLTSFLDVACFDQFVSVPESWQIVITDIQGSTPAIEAGFYREVNLLGACSITAVLNLAPTIDIPFVFGGDGATILIPPMLVGEVKMALADVQYLARSSFNLHLRVGIVPVATIAEAGYEVRVAKLAISDHYHQAMLAGGGVTYATDLVKHPTMGACYQIPGSTHARADLSRLECRWQDIPSRHGEVVSLLVMACDRNPKNNSQTYRRVLETIHALYGEDDNFNPVAPDGLNLSFNRKKLFSEARVRAKSACWFDQQWYLLRVQLENLLGLCLMRFRVTLGKMPWGSYRKIVTTSTDYQKFDDALRMTIAGTASQRQQLTRYLETELNAGKLVYGVHVSDRTLMTCLVFERHGRQVHFVDAADGGYAAAAKLMKQQLQRQVVGGK